MAVQIPFTYQEGGMPDCQTVKILVVSINIVIHAFFSLAVLMVQGCKLIVKCTMVYRLLVKNKMDRLPDPNLPQKKGLKPVYKCGQFEIESANL